jgi:polysaccharide pyruvyl transferase WcaK-like protein
MKKHLSTLLESSDHLIFCGAQTQYDNLGDLIINRILLGKLQTYGTIVVKDKDVPDWYYQRLGLSGSERVSQYQWKFNYLMFFAALRLRLSGSKRAVYLVETPGHRYGTATVEQLKVSLLTLFHYVILWLAGVRICTFGVSIGPFSKSLELLEWCRSRILYFYSVRDSLSETYAEQIGIRRATRFPDLAWLLDVPDEPTDFLLPQGDYVIFSFREQTHNLVRSLDYQQNLYQTLDAIAELVCQTWSKKLVITYQVEMDQVFCRQLAERYESLHSVQFVEERVDLDSMQRIYGGAFMVFSNRLHVLMLAMAFGAIPIAVIDKANHRKITGIFDDADLSNLMIDVKAGDSSVTTLTNLAEQSPELEQNLQTLYAQMRDQGNALLDRVLGV